jgi:hypothetical protein
VRRLHPRSRVQKKKHTSVVTTGPPDRPGIPCASGFNGFLRALPGEPGFVATIAYGSSSDELDISVGISGPHDFAVRDERLRLVRQSRPPHPAPTFVTIAKRPSCVAQDGATIAVDLGVRSMSGACGKLARRANQPLSLKTCQLLYSRSRSGTVLIRHREERKRRSDPELQQQDWIASLPPLAMTALRTDGPVIIFSGRQIRSVTPRPSCRRSSTLPPSPAAPRGANISPAPWQRASSPP